MKAARRGSISADDFARRMNDALGDGGDKTFATALNVNLSTVWRWGNGDTPVPTYAVAVLEFLETLPSGFRPARWVQS